jgi:hypothetical protein
MADFSMSALDFVSDGPRSVEILTEVTSGALSIAATMASRATTLVHFESKFSKDIGLAGPVGVGVGVGFGLATGGAFATQVVLPFFTTLMGLANPHFTAPAAVVVSDIDNPPKVILKTNAMANARFFIFPPMNRRKSNSAS